LILDKVEQEEIVSLEDFCAAHPRVALAFSGGCDSAYLLSVLLDAGVEVGAYLVNSAFQADFELRDAQELASQFGIELRVLELDILSQAHICANPPDRCYCCKRFIFESIFDRMRTDGFEVLVDGTNASDDPLRRPGFRALHELGVLSPLRMAGLTKEEIRQAAKKRGLFTWEKPNFSCLATKVEEGKTITAEELDRQARYFEDDAWNKSGGAR
jgi:uncharacterized protein